MAKTPKADKSNAGHTGANPEGHYARQERLRREQEEAGFSEGVEQSEVEEVDVEKEEE